MASPFTVRPARPNDLPAVHDIWYRDEVADDPQPPANGPVLAGFAYEIERGTMRVAANAEGAPIGFGASVRWDGPQGDLTYLVDLFIDEHIQSHGVGQALLGALPLRDGPCCVHASRDPRAAALYIRWGMRPLWPNFWLVADPDWGARGLSTMPGDDLDIVEAAPDDPDLVTWDTRRFGFARPHDLAWLIDQRAAQPLWFRRGARTIGYGYVQRKCEESLWRPEAATIGPIGAATPDDARDCVCAATRWAVERAGVARLGVPGPHPSLTPLIEAGCHIVYNETFLASDGAPLPDMTRYLPSGVFL